MTAPLNWLTVDVIVFIVETTSVAAAAELGIVVTEHGWDGDERHAVEVIEGKRLIREVDRQAAPADGFAAFGEDRPETLGRSDERAAARVEGIGEARAR